MVIKVWTSFISTYSHTMPVRLGPFSFKANVKNLCSLCTKITWKMHCQMCDRWECHNPATNIFNFYYLKTQGINYFTWDFCLYLHYNWFQWLYIVLVNNSSNGHYYNELLGRYHMFNRNYTNFGQYSRIPRWSLCSSNTWSGSKETLSNVILGLFLNL